MTTDPFHRIEGAEVTMETVEGRTVRVARWKARGEAHNHVPLLFFNGIGANIELVAPFAKHLDSRDFIMFDMPGVGGSPDPLIPYNAFTMTRLAKKLIQQMGYDKVDVMGVSWGGAMAQHFAMQYPKRTRRLVLAATSPGMIMVPGKLSAITKMANPRRYIDPDFMAKNFATLYGGSTKGASGHMTRIKPPSGLGYLYQLIALAGWTSVPFAPFLLKAKTLILMGDDDNIVPVANGKLLNTIIPNSELKIIHGGGHLFLVSQAEETLQMVNDFLDEADAEEAAQSNPKSEAKPGSKGSAKIVPLRKRA